MFLTEVANSRQGLSYSASNPDKRWIQFSSLFIHENETAWVLTVQPLQSLLSLGDEFHFLTTSKCITVGANTLLRLNHVYSIEIDDFTCQMQGGSKKAWQCLATKSSEVSLHWPHTSTGREGEFKAGSTPINSCIQHNFAYLQRNNYRKTANKQSGHLNKKVQPTATV